MRVALVALVAITLAGCAAADDRSHGPTVTGAPIGPAAVPTAEHSTSTVEPSPSITAAPEPQPAATPLPTMPAELDIPIGADATTLVDDVRMRSAPWVGDASIKYVPTLPLDTYVIIVRGPVYGSGYWWYQVRLGTGAHLNGGITQGWVAVADHDGTPWVGQVGCDAPVPGPGDPTWAPGDMPC